MLKCLTISQACIKIRWKLSGTSKWSPKHLWKGNWTSKQRNNFEYTETWSSAICGIWTAKRRPLSKNNDSSKAITVQRHWLGLKSDTSPCKCQFILNKTKVLVASFEVEFSHTFNEANPTAKSLAKQRIHMSFRYLGSLLQSFAILLFFLFPLLFFPPPFFFCLQLELTHPKHATLQP